MPFAPQATGFVIPGLGALFEPLDFASSKKALVSLPFKTRASVLESQFHNGGIAPDVSGFTQQTASATVNSSVAQMQQKASGETAHQHNAFDMSPPKQDSNVMAAATQVEKSVAQGPASSDTPVTPKQSQVTTSPSGAIKESDYVRPSGSPPVWIEKQTARTFKPLRAQNNHRSFETFDGAHAILSGMNPDHYAMPYGVSTRPHISP